MAVIHQYAFVYLESVAVFAARWLGFASIAARSVNPVLAVAQTVADSIGAISCLAIFITLIHLIKRSPRAASLKQPLIALGLFFVLGSLSHLITVVALYRSSSLSSVAGVTISLTTAILLPLSVVTILGIARRADYAASTAEMRLKLLTEGVTEYAIIALDQGGTVVSWNPGAQRIKGYTADEIIGQHFSQFYPKEARLAEQPEFSLEEAKKAGRYEQEGWRVRKDGSRYWANTLITALRDKNGRLIGFSKLTRDLTERREAEQKLRQSEEKFHKAFQAAPLAVTISTIDEGKYIDGNEAFLRIMGRTKEQMIGSKSQETNIWKRPEDRAALMKKLRAEGSADFETTLISLTSGEREVRIFAETVELNGAQCVLAVIEDLTDRRWLEEQYRQAQKMEATGRLAGGLAHDFNNMLNVILGFCQLLQDRPNLDETSHHQLRQIERAGRSAADLTRQLLAFSRQQVMKPVMMDLDSVIHDMNAMLRRLIPEDIEIVMGKTDGLWLTKADPTQIEQIVMNLVVNARDALPMGGTITIETDNVQASEIPPHLEMQSSRVDYVRLVVSDNGVGMSEETRSKVFEPFFTTKELGKGTGLGLSTVYGIVKQSGGFIWVYSEPNQGTSFKIYFPRASKKPAELTSEISPQHAITGSGRILVVEDNDLLRELTVSLLELSGYTVLQAESGPKALEIAQQIDGNIDLLLTDVVLPKMSGRVLAEKMADVRPDTKVVFVSGYTDDTIVKHGILNAGVDFVQKPFTRETLTAKIESVLRREARGAAASV